MGLILAVDVALVVLLGLIRLLDVLLGEVLLGPFDSMASSSMISSSGYLASCWFSPGEILRVRWCPVALSCWRTWRRTGSLSAPHLLYPNSWRCLGSSRSYPNSWRCLDRSHAYPNSWRCLESIRASSFASPHAYPTFWRCLRC